MLNRRMRLLIRTVILIVVVFAIGFTIYQVVEGKQEIKAGDTAPDFDLKDLNGKDIHLADYRGKGVLLNFWGSWCAPCKSEMPYLNQAYKSGIQGVTIIAVNIQENPVTVQSFLENNHINIPVALDRKGVVSDAYKIQPIPVTFLIDKNGKVVKKITGSMTSASEVEKNMRLIQP